MKKIKFSFLKINLLTILVFFATANYTFSKMPESFADLAEMVSPAVVNITTSTTIKEVPRDQAPIIPKGSPFEDLFKDFLERDKGKRPRNSLALGSGFVVSADGYIVTNNHVIDKADEIEIEFYGGNRLKANVVGRDPKTDIALLKVDGNLDLPFVSFGDSDSGRVGDWVMAVGNPLGQGFSVSVGIISARQRELSGVYDDFIQTDAAINRGNSGGPLFNASGEVIGVNTAILSPTGGSIGIGFSMSSNVVAPIVDQLKEFGETRRGWLGVRIQDLTQDIAEAIGVKSVDGILVTEVPQGPAADAGIQSGDIILVFDRVEVKNTKELVNLVGNTDVGKRVDIEILRKGKIKTLQVKLGQRELAEAKAFPSKVDVPIPKVEKILNMGLSNLDDELRSKYSLDSSSTGLIILDISKDSEAYQKGVRVGDLISEVNQKKIVSVKGFKTLIETLKNSNKVSALFLLNSNGNFRFLSLRLD